MLAKSRIYTLLAAVIVLLASPHAAKAQLLPFLEDKPFDVVFEGVESAELQAWLGEVSTLNRQENADSLTPMLLKKHAEAELPELLKALHARGYYDATIRLKMVEESEPPRVVYLVAPGEAYRLQSRHIRLADRSRQITLPDIDAIAPAIGEVADADKLKEAADKIKSNISKNNCILWLEVKPILHLNPATQTADAEFEVDAGEDADFGDINLIGNTSVKKRFFQRKMPWKPGDCFHASQIEGMESSLLKSGLFSTADVTHADAPDAEGQVPVTVTVVERFHRTVKAGVSYMTDEGPGVSAGWEHRNFFGNAEKLSINAVASTLEYSAGVDYTVPYFRHRDQTLTISSSIAREEPDAYTSTNANLRGMVERSFSGDLRAGIGLGYRLSRVEDPINGSENYGLFFLPVYGAYDGRDDILDPKDGSILRVDAAPYVDTLGNSTQFVRSIASGSTYFHFPGEYDTVLAMRGALGSIAGASTRNIPADVRFYAGGGSSVRGYGYEELAPRENGEIIGGKSLLEFSTELRVKMTKTIGGAIFLDGGNAFASEYPDFKEALRWGAGFGGRYYSDFGPLRLDVAFPLNKRSGDSAFQLYVSLGQAF